MRLRDIKTPEEALKLQQAIAFSIDMRTLATSLQEMGFEVDIDEIESRTLGEIEISGGENETGVIITLRLDTVQMDFDTLRYPGTKEDPAQLARKDFS